MEFNQTPSSESSPIHTHAKAAPCHINVLPNEMLSRIFSLLAPRDQLEVREVCCRWAQVLPLATFSNSTTFLLSPETDAYSMLLSSGAAWQHVQVNDLISTPESQDWFRSLAIGSVRRLVFRNSAFTRKFLRSSLLAFPQLEEVAFINSELEKAQEEVVKAEARLWKNFLRVKLKSLTVEVGERENDSLGRLLNTFMCQGSCLRQLVLRITSDEEWFREEIFLYGRGPIYKMIRNSSSTLQHFSLTAQNVDELQTFWMHFPWSCPRLISLRLHTMEMITTSPNFTPVIWTGTSGGAFQEFSSFLGSQSDGLTSLSLPSISKLDDLSDVDRLVTSLPNNLETINMGCSIDFFRFPQFIQKLKKVKDMSIYFFEGQFQDFKTHLFGQVLPELHRLTVYSRPGPLSALSNSFPNLNKLVITCASEEKASADAINDNELQLIITNFTRLTILKLSSCDQITDFGVAGIGPQETESLLRVRADGTDFDELHIVRKGVALQDLQDLEQLSMEGSSQISDVGVKFAFAFKNLRQLDLVNGNKELTDWGLVRLAKLNPSLERMHLETVLNWVDRESLENALVRELKSSGRWKRINVSLRTHADDSLTKIPLSKDEETEVGNMLEILNEIKTCDSWVCNGKAHPAEVYARWKNETIVVFKARYSNLKQTQKDLLSPKLEELRTCTPPLNIF